MKKIDNKLSFAAAVLAFLGTVVIGMDRFTPVHRFVDRLQPWRNIGLAIVDLNTFDTKTPEGNVVGLVEQDKLGFPELVHIIQANRPDLQENTIVAIAKNQSIAFGGQPMKIVHVLFKDSSEGYSLTTDYLFHEWIRDYRDKYFLKFGLSMIALAFFLSVLAHIKWKATWRT